MMGAGEAGGWRSWEPSSCSGPLKSGVGARETPRRTLSVALVTRNRPASLARTLAPLRKQSVQPQEVVIADDSDDEWAPQVRAIARAYGCRYAVGPKRGLCPNRNAPALACRATHIRTIDDDHEFPAGHIEACIAAIIRDPLSWR